MMTRFCERLFPLLLALFALAGCESEFLSKPGATTVDLRRDLADCDRVGPTPAHFWALGLSYEAARNQIAERKAICMNERGWVLNADLTSWSPSPRATG